MRDWSAFRAKPAPASARIHQRMLDRLAASRLT
jgi:hypothetical protein